MFKLMGRIYLQFCAYKISLSGSMVGNMNYSEISTFNGSKVRQCHGEACELEI